MLLSVSLQIFETDKFILCKIECFNESFGKNLPITYPYNYFDQDEKV